jgi:hypothetical protein
VPSNPIDAAALWVALVGGAEDAGPVAAPHALTRVAATSSAAMERRCDEIKNGDPSTTASPTHEPDTRP